MLLNILALKENLFNVLEFLIMDCTPKVGHPTD
ncbi:Uncharacterised protein [Salmonella enterica subsp. salamae]|nr:Uncharacterised protein [Salmonella enterica subsp. salamae]